MAERTWEIAYGAGWDPEIQILVGPLPEAEARRRDAAGEQYSLVAYADERPARVVDIDWSHDYCAVWRLDTERRRHRRLSYRRLDRDWLTLVGIDWWRFRPGQVEGDAEVPHEHETLDTRQGVVWIRYSNGSSGSSGTRGRHLEPGESWSRPVPAFGDWASVLDSEEALAAGSFTVREPDPRGVVPGFPPPWRAPGPMPPTRLDSILTPGLRYHLEDDYGDGIDLVTHVEDGPLLRMPTGRLVAADPGVGVRTPYTIAVDPGDYRIFFLIARSDAGDDSIAAVRLEIRDEPVVAWEMAVRAGQDARCLDEDEFYGFSVDGGLGAFYDEAAADLADYDRDRGDVFFEALNRTWVDYTEPGVPGNVVAFRCPIGDGAYPVWIGRTELGTVACFVAELELLRDAVIESD